MSAHITQGELEVRVVIFSLLEGRLQILLVPAGTGEWGLPGGPVPVVQSLEATASASVQETIGCGEVYLEQLYTYGDPTRVHQQTPLRRTISVIYFALIPTDACRGGRLAPDQVRWMPVDDLPRLYMDHMEIVQYGLRRLRYKLEYSAVGFELLPEDFTLSELQRTYEMILGETLDKRNFRRRILESNIIESTPHRRGGEGRPAQLYRYRPDAVAEVKARRLFP